MSSVLNRAGIQRGRTCRLSQRIGLILAILGVAISISLSVLAQETADLMPDEQENYRIVFRGNEALSRVSLQEAAAEELKAFDRHGPRPSDADDAAFQMELAYRKAGYPFATVDYQMGEAEGRPLVTFTIKEGPFVILKKIHITGNRAFNTQALLPFFEEKKAGLFGQGKLLFVKSDMELALAQIREFYISKGYLDAVIGEPRYTFNSEQTEATLTFEIKEGTRYIIHDLLFKGDVLNDAEHALKELRKGLIGKPYFRRRKVSLGNRMRELYGNLGYPRARIEVGDQQGDEPGRVVLVAEISKGPHVTISRIIIKGNDRTREEFIRSRLLLKPGDRFDLKKQQESFRRLYATGLFSKVDLRLEERKASSDWPLLVEVQEAPAKEFYLEPGWGSYEKLRGKAGFREKNLFGTGRIFSVDGAASFKAQGLEASLTDPWFLNTDITANFPVYYSHREEPSFTRKDRGASILFSKKFTEHLSAAGGYGFRMTDLSDVDPYEEETPDDYNLGSVKLQTTYDTRNDLFFPTNRGQRGFISVEHADTSLGGDITFTRLTGGIRFFFPLFKDTILAMRYSTGLIIPGSEDVTVPVGEKFFNGGENTVRSFKQSELGPKDAYGRPAGGLAFNVINVELRQRLIGNLVGTVFFDMGNISPNRSRSELGLPPYDSRSDVLSDTFNQYFEDFRLGVGFGLQYLLPIGPARIDFAFNPDRDEERGEELFVFHFSVGMAF